jgi:hypothetical protein
MGPPEIQDPAAERGIFLFLRRGIRGLWPLENLQPLAYLVSITCENFTFLGGKLSFENFTPLFF